MGPPYPRRHPPSAARLVTALAALVAVVVVASIMALAPTARVAHDDAQNRPTAPAPPATGPGAVNAGTDPQTAAATPAPTLPAVALPGLVGAIGDSLTAGVNASGSFGIQPEHSWVVGTDPDDGVRSHLERIRELGGRPVVASPFRPGAAIAAAPRQAAAIVASASTLPQGASAWITFELGANDVCAPTADEMTEPEVFADAAREAFETLERGLPPGSGLLVVSVPDVARLPGLLAEIPAAVDLHRQYGVCASVLAVTAELDRVRERIAAYNDALVTACESLDPDRLPCRHDLAGDLARSLFGAPFTLADLSSLDFFHPSLAGQARIADETWALTPWGAGVR